ncbi:MAG: short chain dehydrogenase family protein [Hyphomicrobiales bacterium]|nr:short chain dehydrogenase family protein [Hyphomicrobiales bacterium]
MAKILIYGATGGIGEASARELHAQGQELHLVGRKSEAVQSLAGELGASYTVADLEDESAFARATEEAAAGGALAGLVFAVGTINLKPIARLTRADFERDFLVNAVWAAQALQAAQAALVKNEGGASVVLFSSVAVSQGFTGHASIGMAKGAIEGLMRSLAAELAPKVRVNCVAPSLTRTPLAEKLVANPQMADAIAAMHALPRLGEPEDIAQVVALLAGPRSTWITGQVIAVDGGRSTLRTKG